MEVTITLAWQRGFISVERFTGLDTPDLMEKRSLNLQDQKSLIKPLSSHLVMAGVDITTVKKLLGYKTLTMTLRYDHFAPSHKVKAVDLLNETLTGKPTIQKLYKKRRVTEWLGATLLILMVGPGGFEPPTSTVSR
jgi:hypothetical protein